MAKNPSDEEIWESVATELCSAIAKNNIDAYTAAMDSVDDKTRARLEQAFDNHAARQRAKGVPGW